MASETETEISTKVQESLEGTPFACSKLEKLSGGTANFVYRGTLKAKLGDGEETVVIKHTEGYVASNPGFKLTDRRCEYEQEILTALHSFPPLLESGIEIQTPHIHYFDTNTNTQVYTDLSSSLDLKNYVLTHSSTLTRAQSERLGHALGTWCKKFHVWGTGEERKELREIMKGNEMRELKFTINYQMLLGTVDVFPEILAEKRGLFEKVAESVRELDEKDGDLIHGDFWCGNILLPSSPIPDQPSKLKVFIIDWEMSQLSHRAFDLGQMIAELYELKHYKGHSAGGTLIEAFIKGYGEMDEDLKWKAIIHTGVHFIGFGSRVAGWGTKEQIEELVKIGRDWIVGAWEKKKEVFDGTPLAAFFIQ